MTPEYKNIKALSEEVILSAFVKARTARDLFIYALWLSEDMKFVFGTEMEMRENVCFLGQINFSLGVVLQLTADVAKSRYRC